MTLRSYPVGTLRDILRATVSPPHRRALLQAMPDARSAMQSAVDAINSTPASVDVDVTVALWMRGKAGYSCIELYGPLLPYPCWDASQGRFADDDVDRRTYARFAMHVGQALSQANRRERSGTRWRIASALIEEVRTSQLCIACAGAGCVQCGHTGLVRRSMRWRADACEVHFFDFRANVLPIYRGALRWITDRDREGLRIITDASPPPPLAPARSRRSA